MSVERDSNLGDEYAGKLGECDLFDLRERREVPSCLVSCIIAANSFSSSSRLRRSDGDMAVDAIDPGDGGTSSSKSGSFGSGGERVLSVIPLRNDARCFGEAVSLACCNSIGTVADWIELGMLDLRSSGVRARCDSCRDSVCRCRCVSGGD